MKTGSSHRRSAQTSSPRRYPAAVVAVALIAILAAPMAAQAQVVTPPAPQYVPITIHASEFDDHQRWAERTEVAGDLNGDGINDFWIGVPAYQRGDVPYGRVYAADGAKVADPQGNKNRINQLAEIHPPEPQVGAQFGFWIENVTDVSGDGISDLAVGTDAQDVPIDPTQNSQICDNKPEACRQNQGKAWVFDGKTNKVLYELNNPRPQGSPTHAARFGSRIGRAGDVTGDGISDIIVGASGNDNPEFSGCSDTPAPKPGCRFAEGQAFIFNGRNGALIRELNLPKEDQIPPTTCITLCGSLGLAVQGVGDVDGDGVTDQLVDAASQNAGVGRMYVYSGATGLVIRRIDPPIPSALGFFGFQDVTWLDPGDVNGDLRPDIYGSSFFGGERREGRAWVFNGGLGTPVATPLLYEVQNPNRNDGQAFGWSMTRDRNRTRAGDPFDDSGPTTNPLYIGNAPHHTANGNQQGETNTFNASTGGHLQTLPLPLPWATEPGRPANPDLGPNLGWTVSSPGDLNRDGFRDFVAGAPFTNVCEVMLGSMNKKLNIDQGVLISFRSLPTGSETDPGNNNPGDNQCQPANNP